MISRSEVFHLYADRAMERTATDRGPRLAQAHVEIVCFARTQRIEWHRRARRHCAFVLGTQLKGDILRARKREPAGVTGLGISRDAKCKLRYETHRIGAGANPQRER